MIVGKTDPGTEHLAVEAEGHVSVLTFRGGEHNHISQTLVTLIADALDELDNDDNCRCVVLKSEGRVFCAGAQLGQQPADDEERRRNEAERQKILAGEMDDPFYGQVARLFASRKPIVVAVQGAAVGAGLGLTTVGDFRVASPAARFAANFVVLGFHPGFGLTYILPRLIGEQNAALMMLTGRRFKGEEAKEMGLVDRLVEADQLESATMELAQEIAAASPLGVESTRATLRGEAAARIAEQMRLEWRIQDRLRQTEDFAEGIAAVRERRPGNYKRR